MTQVFFKLFLILTEVPQITQLLHHVLPATTSLPRVHKKSHTMVFIASRELLAQEVICLPLLLLFCADTSLFCWLIKFQQLAESVCVCVEWCGWESWLLFFFFFTLYSRGGKLFMTSTNVLWIYLPLCLCAWLQRDLLERGKERERDQSQKYITGYDFNLTSTDKFFPMS